MGCPQKNPKKVQGGGMITINLKPQEPKSLSWVEKAFAIYREFMRQREVTHSISELRQKLDAVKSQSRRAQYRYGGVAGLGSYDNPLEFSESSRRGLLSIIWAVQSGLSEEDLRKTDRELLRGVWSLLNDFWHHGITERPYPETRAAWFNSRYRGELERLLPVLSNGGLVALLDAQLVYWETFHSQKALRSLGSELDEFLGYWKKLARELGLPDNLESSYEARVVELQKRARNSESYPILSPHGWDRG